MENREILKKLIKETERTKELTDSVIRYFKLKNYDTSIIMKKFKPLLEGNLDAIKDEEVSELIVIFGGKTDVVDNINDSLVGFETSENDLDSKSNLDKVKPPTTPELYNELVGENHKLEIELKNKEKQLSDYKSKTEELEEKVKEMSEQMSKFDQMFELLRKFNITEQGELVKVEKEIINEAYLIYTVENKTEHKNTFIIQKDDTINVVSEYYTIRK